IPRRLRKHGLDRPILDLVAPLVRQLDAAFPLDLAEANVPTGRMELATRAVEEQHPKLRHRALQPEGLAQRPVGLVAVVEGGPRIEEELHLVVRNRARPGRGRCAQYQDEQERGNPRKPRRSHRHRTSSQEPLDSLTTSPGSLPPGTPHDTTPHRRGYPG